MIFKDSFPMEYKMLCFLGVQISANQIINEFEKKFINDLYSRAIFFKRVKSLSPKQTNLLHRIFSSQVVFNDLATIRWEKNTKGYIPDDLYFRMDKIVESYRAKFYQRAKEKMENDNSFLNQESYQ